MQGKKGRLDNSSTCPIHGGHKWGKCYENRFGENYKPPAADSKTSTSANDNGRKTPKAKKDAHASESVERSDEDADDSYFCQECKNNDVPYDLLFFDADTEMEAEDYDRTSTQKVAFTPL
ncbi:MAG: hypothetical protein ACREOZ_02980 [Gloeomargaritales cyanobacterium]